MGVPIVVVASGGLPVTLTANNTGAPMTIATSGFGLPVTVVASGGLPVTGFTTGPDVTAPIIISSNTISQPENSALVHFLQANETVTWAKVGGADAAQFTITSGSVLGLPAKDYEAPDDADANGTFVVQVQATDLASNVSAIQTITVTITNVSEAVDAPTLSWESTPAVNPPLLVVGLPDDTEAGDHIVIEISDDDGATWDEYLDVVVDDPDAAEQEETAAALVDGDYVFRARMERGLDVSAWSGDVNVTIFNDVIAPVVVTFNPPDNTTGVSPIADLIMTFDELIVLGTSGVVTLKKTSDNSTVDSWDAATDEGSGAGQLQVTSGNQLQMKLTSSLAASTEYYVVATAGVVEDYAGNPSNALSSTTTWSFTTAAGAWSPLDASTPAVWWVDASDVASITKTGTAPNELVTQWNDLSGNGRHLTPAVAGPVYTTGIINGLPAILTSGTPWLQSTTFSVSQPLLLVMVWRSSPTTPAGYGILFAGDRDSVGGGLMYLFTKGGSNNYTAYAGSTEINQGVAIATDTTYRSEFLVNSASSISKLNGSTVGPTDGGSFGIVDGIALGNASGGGQSAHAWYGEIFVIPNPTAGDITNAAAYTLAKWGV